MKKITQNILIFFISILILGSCEDSLTTFGDMNTNPTASNKGNLNYMFTYSQLTGSGERYENWRTNLIYCSTMIQHFGSTALWESHGGKYTFNEGYSSSYFDRYYSNYIRDLIDIIEKTKDKPELANKNACARIWRIILSQRLTDLYGAVPYYESGKGYLTLNFRPKYDSQKDIYLGENGFLNDLKKAVKMLDENKVTFGDADLFYKGDVKKWKKLANSLMLRCALRLVKVDEAKAKEWVAEALKGSLLELGEDCFIMHTSGEGINRNGNGEVLGTWNNVLSKTFINHLNNTKDPRIEILAQMPDNVRPFVGVEIGTTKGNNDGKARINEMLRGVDDPMFFITNAEVEYMLAECALRGWGGATDAKSHYEAGIKSAMKVLENYDDKAIISDKDVTKYIDNNPFVGTNSNKFKLICNEYWIVTLLNEYEAYANWRRTGLPVLVPTNYKDNKTNGTIPRRLCFNGGESSNNKKNYTNAINKLPHLNKGNEGGMIDRNWWDVITFNNPN